MAHELSKTARASMLAAEGLSKKVATAWVFEHHIGLQTRPYVTFYGKTGKADAYAYVAHNPKRYYAIAW